MSPDLRVLLPFVFPANAVSTLAMTGLIWFVQRVHYPLFLRADPATFVAFETEHANRVTAIAFPLMSVELGTGVLMLWPHLRPGPIPQSQALLALALTLLTWASTVFLQIPLHNRLHRGFSRRTIERLVATNWLRTAAWTAHALLFGLWFMHLAISC